MPLPPDIARLLAEVNLAAQKYDDSNSAEEERLSLFSKEAQDISRFAEELSDLVKPVEDTLCKFINGASALACANIAIGCGLLAPWPSPNMSAKDLATLTKADEKLISKSNRSRSASAYKTHADGFAMVARIMRALVLYKVFAEVEEEVYAHTALSQTLFSSPLTPYYRVM